MRPSSHPHLAISQSDGKTRIDFRKQADPVDKAVIFIAFVALTWALFVWLPNFGNSEPMPIDGAYIGVSQFFYALFFILFAKRVLFPRHRWIVIDKQQVLFGYKTLFRKVERAFDKVDVLELTHSHSKNDNDNTSFLSFVLKTPIQMSSSISIKFTYRGGTYFYLYRLSVEEADSVIELINDNKLKTIN